MVDTQHINMDVMPVNICLSAAFLADSFKDILLSLIHISSRRLYISLSLALLYPWGGFFTTYWSETAVAVSYTHLDVYKRQAPGGAGPSRTWGPEIHLNWAVPQIIALLP